MIFDAVDKMMPKEGLDYLLHVTFSGNKFMIRFEGLTELGKAFASHCQTNVNQVITMLMQERGGKKDDPDGGKDGQRVQEGKSDKPGKPGENSDAKPAGSGSGPAKQPEEKHVPGRDAADVRPPDAGKDIRAAPGTKPAGPVS